MIAERDEPQRTQQGEGMASTRVTLDALRAIVAVDFGPNVPPTLVSRVRDAWSGASATTDAAPDRILEYATVPDEERFLEGLSGAVTLEALAHERGKAVLLHACGIALPDGRVVTFIGPSGRGKTTLSRALAGHYGYVSDESIAIGDDLTVYPYRKPLSVVRPGLPKEQVSPSAAGLRDLPDVPLSLAALVLIERDESLAAPVVEHLHFVDAVEPLVAQASYLADLPGSVVTLARLCDRSGGIRRVRYAEAGSVADVIDQLAATGPAQEPWTPRTLAVVAADGSDASADAVDYGDVMVVLSDRTLRVLEGIAPAVLRAVSEGAGDVDAVVASVVAQMGPPPGGDATAQVAVVLQELADAGFAVPRAAGH